MMDDLCEMTPDERARAKMDAGRPMGVLAAERERAGATEPASPAAGTSAQPCPAPVSLLSILLAQLRALQPEWNCYLCLTSDSELDICATHRERLESIVNYGRDAA